MKNVKSSELNLTLGETAHRATPTVVADSPKTTVNKEAAKELYLPRVTPFLKSFTSTVRTYKTKASLIEEMGSLSEKEAQVLSEGFRLTAKFFEEQGTKVLDKAKK